MIDFKYSFLTEAFLNDYNRNTTGIFEFLFSGNKIDELKKKIEKVYKFTPKFKSEKRGNLSSLYYISPDKTKLIRISDHWSKSNIKGVRECGYIGNCFWVLYSKRYVNCKDKYQVGIIEISKLRKI